LKTLSNPSGSLIDPAAAIPLADRFRRTRLLAIAIGAVCLIAAVPLALRHSARPASDGLGATPPSTTPTASSAPTVPVAPPRTCGNCGEVVNIRVVRKEGESSGVGAVAGGALGGVLGHQVGAGRGKEAMTVLGVIGGALGGNQVEKQDKARTFYLVDVRMADGSARTITEATPPSLAVGAPVRVEGNTIALR